jgi:hypothetical protein
MIVFNLSCDNDHRFEGWFDSAAGFESQQQSKLLSCPVCGNDQVRKELHAPYVNTGAVRTAPTTAVVEKPVPQQAVFHKAIADLVDHVMANTEDVGDAFPEEARKIHYSEVPERAIRGNASADEITDLREEGIEVISVPVPKYRIGNSH